VGAACGGHPWRVLAAWVVLLGGLLAGSAAVGASYSNDVNLSGTQSATGLSLLEAHKPGAPASTTRVLWSSIHGRGRWPRTARSSRDSITALGKLPHVVSASDPLL